MTTYLIKRLGMTVAVVLIVMAFLSSLVHLVPGDPVEIMLGPQASAAQIAEVRSEMRLDEPVYMQLWHFITGALRGDFGVDFQSREPVSHMIAEALPHTVLLALASLALAALVGIPLGVLAARHQNTIADRILGLTSVGFITVPSYVAALFLLLLFAVRLDVLPAIGAGDLSDPVDYLRHLALPASALALGWIGYIARLVRTSMLTVLGTNYVRTAHAFGIRDRVVFYRWALKNAIIPTVAVLGSGLGNLLGGAVLVEVIFSRPGLGRITVEAISDRNYPVVQGTVLVIAVFYVLANLLADLSYRLLDPRIRIEQAAPGV